MEKGAETDEVPGQSELPADNALIVLPPNARETANVEWLTVPPPPAGPEGAAQGLADHPAALYLARLAPSSRQTIRCVLGGVAQTLSAGRHTLWSLPWHQVRYPQMSALRAHLAATYAPATANLYMTAVRGVLAECWQLGLLSAEEKARACNLPPPHPGRAGQEEGFGPAPHPSRVKFGPIGTRLRSAKGRISCQLRLWTNALGIRSPGR